MSKKNKTEETEEKQERGSNCTPPQQFRLPSGSSTHIAWERSLEAQIKYQKVIKEEAKKCAEIRGYKPSMKIGKRFQHFFKAEVIEAQQRAKRKSKRSKNDNTKKTR